MTISATANSCIAIGSTTVATTVSEFEEDTFIDIGEVEDLGEWGATSEELILKTVTDPWTRRRKGTMDAGSISLIVARDTADPGQQALHAAVDSNLPFAFEVELSDKATPEADNTKFYFMAVVLSERSNFGQADNIVRTTFTLGIDGELFEVPAGDAVLPSTITDLAAIVLGATSAQLWFSPADDATSHQVRFSVHEADAWSAPATFVPGGTLAGLVTATEYDIQVRGVNASGFGAWSTSIQATTD